MRIDCSNHHGISLIPVMTAVLSSIILSRLTLVSETNAYCNYYAHTPSGRMGVFTVNYQVHSKRLGVFDSGVPSLHYISTW